MKFSIPKKDSLDNVKLTFKSIYIKRRPVFKFNEPFERYIKEHDLKITEYDVASYIYKNIIFYEDGQEIWVKITKFPERKDIYDFILLLENGSLKIKKQNLVSSFIKSILGFTDSSIYFGVNKYVS